MYFMRIRWSRELLVHGYFFSNPEKVMDQKHAIQNDTLSVLFFQEDIGPRNFSALPLSTLCYSCNRLRPYATWCTEPSFIKQCHPFKCPCCVLAPTLCFWEKSSTRKLASIKSFPSSQSTKHKTKSCNILISFAAHHQLKERTQKAQSRSSSQYKRYLLLTLTAKSLSRAKHWHSSISTWTQNVPTHASRRLLLHLQPAKSHR